MKTLDEFKREAEKAITHIRQNHIRLGRIVHQARKTLSAADLGVFLLHLSKLGMARSDIDASVAAYLYEHPKETAGEKTRRINPLLVFAGASNAKVLNVSEEDQKRLLSDEKFDVVDTRGATRQKDWAEMLDYERNLLLARDGRIKSKEEQLHSLNEKSPTTKVLGGVEAEDEMLRFKAADGTVILTVGVREFLEILGQENWQRLKALEPEAAIA